MNLFYSALLCFVLISCSSSRSEKPLNPDTLAKLTGKVGMMNTETHVYKIMVPRKDLSVSIHGINITDAVGLTAWAAFTGTQNHTILMGEVPLLENEVNGFLNQALLSGLEVTSLHNAFLWDSPRVLSLYFEALGNQEQLAIAVGS